MPGRVAPLAVRRDLDARSKRALARRLPWPYNGMVSDITSAIQTCCNYLAASGLMSYTEICGRQMFFGGNHRATNFHCFEAFLEHMGVAQVLNHTVVFRGKQLRFHDVVRNGLVHEYFMKSAAGGVALTSASAEGRHTGFFIRKPGELWFAVTPYFNLFAAALDKAVTTRTLPAWKQ